MIKNVYGTNLDKNALIVYLEGPFVEGKTAMHTNTIEAIEQANIISERGYNIDILDYTEPPSEIWKVPFRKYDLVIGISIFWLNMALKLCRKECVIIFYATGAHSRYACEAQKRRCDNFTARTHVEVVEDRKIESNHTYKVMDKIIAKVDAIFCMGNEWNIGTYIHLNKNIFPIVATGFQYKKYIEQEVEVNKHAFLWFGSWGLIHKGLDLCIEVFKKRKEEMLYIAGVEDNTVFPTYSDELKQGNIRYEGLLDVRTKKYEQLCNKCTFIIFPSCSEASATSVLTVMAMGLIPIVTKQVGLNIGDFGFELANDDIETIGKCVDYVVTLSDEEIRRRKRLTYEYVINNYSIKAYREKLESALNKVISK